MDPANIADTGYFNNSEMVPLYGPSYCTVSGGLSTCRGGIGGVFLSAEWSDLQSAPVVAGGTTSVVPDPNGDVFTMMQAINGIETAYDHTYSSTWTFLMTLGLKTGQYAAYDVLDMYTAASGAPTGAQPRVGTALPVVTDLVEGNCKYHYDNNGNPNRNGGNFATNGFPEQCVLSQTNVGKDECTAMPRIFGKDTPSVTNNPYYTTAFKQAMQDFANLVTGVTGYGKQHNLWAPFSGIETGRHFE